MSNVYENWLMQQPQFGLNEEIKAITATTDLTFLKVRVVRMPSLLKPEKDIAETYNMLKSVGSDLDIGDLTIGASGFNSADKIAEFQNLIMKVLHMVSKNRAPSDTVAPGTTSDDMKFRIAANGDVEIVGKDGNGNDVVMATAYQHANMNSTHFAMCDKQDGNNVDACRKHMAFVAGVYTTDAEKTGAFTTGDATKHMDKFFDLGTNGDQAAQRAPTNAHRVANAYSVLKRIGWWAYDNNSGVYAFKDFTKALRTENEDLIKMLIPMLTKNTAAKDDEIKDTEDADWEAFYKGKLNNYGEYIVKCIDILNNNTAIFKAQLETQRFAIKKTSDRFMGRMASLKAAGNQIDDVWRPHGGVSRIYVGQKGGQVGGSINGTNASNIMRHQLDTAVSNLARNGKRLSTSTMTKFEGKFQKLAEAENTIEKFIANVKNLNGALESGDSNAIKLGRNISDQEITDFKKSSTAVANATYVLETGISNINLRMVEQPKPVERSGHYKM